MDQETCTKRKYVKSTRFIGGAAGAELFGGATGTILAAFVISPLAIGGLTAVAIIAEPSIVAGYYGGDFAKEKFEVLGEILYRKMEVDTDLDVIKELRNSSFEEDNRSVEIELVSEYDSR